MLSTPLLMNYFDLKECCLLINIMIICSLAVDSEYEMKVLLSSAAETVCESHQDVSSPVYLAQIF